MRTILSSMIMTSQVKPNAPGFKQSKSCSSGQDVHIIQNSVDSTLQPAGITHVQIKLHHPQKVQILFLVCTTCVDNTNVRAETPVLSSRSEEESLSCLDGIQWRNPFMCHRSDPESLSNLDGNSIDTEELLHVAELSNCEKIV